jgi:hypothetical protein
MIIDGEGDRGPVIHPTLMMCVCAPTTLNHQSTMSQSPSSTTCDWTYEQRFEPFKDLGGPAPHINIITSDKCTLKVSAKILSDAS